MNAAMNAGAHDDMVRRIVAAHQTLRLEPPQPQTRPLTSDAPIYRAAKQACLQLGFIEIDAECLGQAWQAMVLRKGRFDPTDWPSDPVDFDMRPWPRANAFAPCPRRLGLYAVLPDAAWIARMARAGVPALQLRFKSDDAAAVAREVRAAVDAVRDTGAMLFVNDHWQAAIAAGAYGVHLGQEDMATADLAAIRAAGLRLGLSSHGYAEMLRADRHSPSYIAMGAVYATNLKQMPTAPQGPSRLAAYARLMRHVPQVAIGGIDEARLPQVAASGVGSVAVVRAIVAAEAPEAAARRMMAAIGDLALPQTAS
ncbi:MAG: Thiamin-phosphate pyrophosphorylase [Burkholderiaceae bacterium]|jgi:thiamine-phosphate pyrophosphorylase|nr:MAG: Thiamin-phosphate pyrophosphorylase [Burkholderiaceae bacterium]